MKEDHWGVIKDELNTTVTYSLRNLSEVHWISYVVIQY